MGMDDALTCSGQRSLPSCLGGGDLDGDVYNVTEFEKLFPKHQYAAAAYTAATRKELDRLSTIDDVADFVVDYIVSDVCRESSPIPIWDLTITIRY